MSLLEITVRVLLRLSGKEGRIAALKQEASTIRYIRNPSESDQLTALDGHPLFIRFIKNPTVEAQSSAVNQNKSAFEYIENPDPTVAMLAKLME